MIWVITIVPAVLCMFIFAGFDKAYLKKRDRRPISFSEILVFLNRIRISGLLKLIDPLEEAYIRQDYLRAEFLYAQAMRFAQAREYFKKIVANAIILQSFGYRHVKGGDDTKRFLAHRLINYAVPVKMWGRAGLFALFVLRRLLFWIPVRLPLLHHVVEETIGAYVDLKEAALMLARHAEAGIEVKVASRL